MHVALFAPFSSGPIRGNIVTVNRIARRLNLSGVQTTVIAVDQPGQADRIPQPDLIHAFHAFHSGPRARAVAQQLQIPYLITITGSDLFDPSFRDHPATIQALQDARAITCFDRIIAQQLATAFPLLGPKLSIIPQGVEPLPDSPPLPRPADCFIILLPAALRPVKGILEAIGALAPLAARLPNLHLWLAGGVLDETYAAQVQAAATRHPWITLLGEIPYDRMGAVYAAADLVLNSSRFEGGMANALLEAMAMGKPVVAADIPGNRSLLRHGATGWLYCSDEQLRDLIRNLKEQPGQREQVGRAAQQFVKATFSPQKEAAELRSLYCQLLQG